MVKRLSRIPRTNVELPDEVMAAFRQALKIRDHRERQLEDGERCPGLGGCETCNEYERLVAIVDTALGVRPSELSPVDVIDGPAPPMWKDQASRRIGTGLELSTWRSPRLPRSSRGRRPC